MAKEFGKIIQKYQTWIEDKKRYNFNSRKIILFKRYLIRNHRWFRQSHNNYLELWYTKPRASLHLTPYTENVLLRLQQKSSLSPLAKKNFVFMRRWANTAVVKVGIKKLSHSLVSNNSKVTNKCINELLISDVEKNHLIHIHNCQYGLRHSRSTGYLWKSPQNCLWIKNLLIGSSKSGGATHLPGPFL